MTNSAIQTEDGAAGAGWRVSPRLLLGLLLLVGWVLILHANRWRPGVPVFFLCAGWLALLAAGRALWSAGMEAASEDGAAPESAPGHSRSDELLAEKKSLLKAIKEVEFDHQMGKMSDQDAQQIIRFYRARAIEIIKELDRLEQKGGAAPRSLAEAIEQDVAARLALGRSRGAAASKAGSGAGRQKAAGGDGTPVEEAEGESGTAASSGTELGSAGEQGASKGGES
jgi:hypothetical protein